MNTSLLILLVVVVVIVAIAAIVLVQRSLPAAQQPAPTAVKAPERGLRSQLSRTRSAIGGTLGTLLRSDNLDDAFWDELEETLIAADVGVGPSTAAVEQVRKQRPSDGEQARQLLEQALISQLSGRDRSLHLEGKPAVVLVVGVNGTGEDDVDREDRRAPR